jgi:glycine cleavage system regulatory protein
MAIILQKYCRKAKQYHHEKKMFEINIFVSISVGNKVHTIATDFKEIHLTSLGACLVGF